MNALFNKIKRWVEQQTRETLSQMEVRAKELTPTDTWELINSYETTYDPWTKSWVIKNVADHAWYVEFGTQNATFYHKWPPTDASTVYRTTGDYEWLRGARMMTQTADEFRDTFRRQITSKVNDQILTSR